MAKHDTADPLFWSQDAVCSELCSDSSPWTNDPGALKLKILEHLIDGETLLTYSYHFSSIQLMDLLGIRAAKHQVQLSRKLSHLRNGSSAFKQWLQDHLSSEQGDTQTRDPHVKEVNVETSLAVFPTTPETLGLADRANVARTPLRPVIASLPLSEPERGSNSTPAANSPSLPTHDIGDEGDRPPKRRRLQPQSLGIEARQQNGMSIGMDLNGIKTYVCPNLATEVLQAVVDESPGSDAFSLQPLLPLPAEARRYCNKVLKAEMLMSGKNPRLLKEGHLSLHAKDTDSVVDFENLTDNEDDEDTRKELEQDMEEERLAKQLSCRTKIFPADVKLILDKTVKSMALDWEEKHRPKWESKAYDIWTRAFRHSCRHELILLARKNLERSEMLIHTAINAVPLDQWSKEKDIVAQAESFRSYVSAKAYHAWELKLLTNPHQPAKPVKIQKPRRITPRELKKPRIDEDGEEDLGSGDSADDGEFIVNDQETILRDADYVTPTASPPKFRSPQGITSPMEEQLSNNYIDLTLDKTPKKANTTSKEVTNVIDLTEPAPKKESISMFDYLNTPLYGETFDVPLIGREKPKTWTKLKDRWRLSVCMLWKMKHRYRKAIFELLRKMGSASVWDTTIQPVLSDLKPKKAPFDDSPDEDKTAMELAALYLSFIRCRYLRPEKVVPLKERDKVKLSDNKTQFTQFCGFISAIEHLYPQDNQIFSQGMHEDDFIDVDDLESAGADPNDAQTKKKTRKPRKEIIQDRNAVQMRLNEEKRAEEMQQRTDELRKTYEKEAKNGVIVAMDRMHHIINESKREHEALIYVNEYIGQKIKKHQVEGVRFLWNQIVADGGNRQGCLLAHTMGLGKTMQAITFLVAISEASQSPDPSVHGQIPSHLRQSQTLILCPSGLVDNWMEEIDFWVPSNILGAIRKVESSMKHLDREHAVKQWGRSGGVLIVGYGLIKSIIDGDNSELDAILTDSPNIVIADEAHMLKTPDSKVTRVCSKFKTKSRIALTGSPLANEVMEYYHMVNWVASNYLGPEQEFSMKFATPIHSGLWSDSNESDRRAALRLLLALKNTVAPKVHRATMNSCLKGQLPAKHEFVISVAPSDMQNALYDLYIEAMRRESPASEKLSQGKVFGILSALALVCTHPLCLRERVLEIQKEEAKGNPDARVTSLPSDVVSQIQDLTSDVKVCDTHLSRKVELLVQILDESFRAKDKVLVFSQSKPTLNYLEKLLEAQNRRVCRLDGQTPIPKRQNMTKMFNEKDTNDIWLISTTAGGVGLNIQGANRVVIFDFKWNPVNDQQAVGRAYRIGQQKEVFVYKFVVAGTFEQILQNKAVFKTQLASRVVDRKNPLCWSNRLGKLVGPIKNVPAKDLSEFWGKDKVLDKLIANNDSAIIRSILSTDTFEEEDPTSELTEEERREAQALTDSNLLRNSDPARYEQLMREKIDERVDKIKIPQSTSVSAPTTERRQSDLSSSLDGSCDAENSDMPRWYLHFPGRREHLGSPAMQTIPTVPATSALVPMRGTNTFFADTSVNLGETVCPQPTSHIQHSTIAPKPPQPTRPVLFGTPKSSGKDLFEQALKKALLENFSDVAHGTRLTDPQDVTAAIHAYRSKKGFGFLPDNKRWRLLREYLNDARFFTAIKLGLVQAKFLALASEAELAKCCAALRQMSHEALHSHIKSAELARGSK